VGNVGRAIKNLLAGADGQLKKTRAAFTAARTSHYALTLPWVSNPSAERMTGPRLLPNTLFEKYLTEMSELRKRANQELDTLIAEYPEAKRQAIANLGGMADPNDYPDEAGIRAAFRLSFDFVPIPAGASFAGLPDRYVRSLSQQLERKQAQAAQVAQQAMWEQVRERVEHVVDRLRDPDTRFKSSTVEACRELVTLLPGWNVTGDGRVSEIVHDIDTMLHGVDAEVLRKNTGTRKEVANMANAITDKLSQWGL
jgi:hypothetical protein